jgi:hypothetical protein
METEETRPVGRPRSLLAGKIPTNEPAAPAAREESPRDRAARRAAELRGHLGDMNQGTDDFFVPPEYIPDGWSYEWKRKTNVGMEDPAYQVALARMGWEPVPAARHPSMMPDGNKYLTIERKGMILMERPLEITEESRQIDRNNARNQIRQKEAQLSSAPDGGLGHRDHAQVKPKISKSYEAIPIPKD